MATHSHNVLLRLNRYPFHNEPHVAKASLGKSRDWKRASAKQELITSSTCCATKSGNSKVNSLASAVEQNRARTNMLFPGIRSTRGAAIGQSAANAHAVTYRENRAAPDRAMFE